MSFPEWSLLVGLGMSLSLAIWPWMFMVHAKLAVIASKSADVCEKLDTLAAEQRALWAVTSRHDSRLDTHDVQLGHIAERLHS